MPDGDYVYFRHAAHGFGDFQTVRQMLGGHVVGPLIQAAFEILVLVGIRCARIGQKWLREKNRSNRKHKAQSRDDYFLDKLTLVIFQHLI